MNKTGLTNLKNKIPNSVLPTAIHHYKSILRITLPEWNSEDNLKLFSIFSLLSLLS